MKHLFLIVIAACWFRPVPAQINWTPYENNPVINPSFDTGSQTTYRPVVVPWKGKYHMWYGKLWLEQRWIAYATSIDGLEWEAEWHAVLGPSSEAGSFDEFEATHGWVIAAGDTLRMWYSGGGSQGSSIGLAWSVDGISWARVEGSATGGSVLDAALAGNGVLSVTHPTVVKQGEYYHMWYVRVTGTTSSDIGYARSTDGMSWQTVSGSDPNGAAIVRGDGQSFDGVAMLYPAALHNGVHFEMWYQGLGADPFVGIVPRVGCAKSIDGIDWEKIAGEQADAGACFNSLAQPFVLLEEDLYRMWYALSATDPNDDVVQYATSARVGTSVRDDEVPSLRPRLDIYPNPTTSRATVLFHVEQQAAFVMEIHDMLGRRVARIDLRQRIQGAQRATWDGKDSNGVYVPSGAYVLTIANSSTGERSTGGIVHVLR